MKGTCLVLLSVLLLSVSALKLRTLNKKTTLMSQVFGKKTFSGKPEELVSDFQTFLDLVRGKQQSSNKI